jgi:predicted nucleic acid-binding protein
MSLQLIEDANFGLSGQVLSEFYNNATRKLAVPLTPDEASDWVVRLARVPTVPVDAELVQAGIVASRRYQLSYWDGAVVAAAQRLGAPVLYTEDLNHGQAYGSVRVVNPFRDQ